MSDSVYHKIEEIPNKVLFNELLDTVIFSQEYTARKLAKRLGMSPQAFDYHIQKRKKEVAKNAR